MNEFATARSKCHVGIKALQNLRASVAAFERLGTLADSKDFLIISSIFQIGVIRYAKPFLSSKSKTGNVKYLPTDLAKTTGFNLEMHSHLLAVRNTLVAHDDLTQIEPRIVFFGITPTETDVSITTSMIVANKCISHPADTTTANQFYDHARAAHQGAMNKLHADITSLREIARKHPEQAKSAQKYSKNYGTANIEIGGTQLNPPDFSNDDWLNNDEPNFSSIHNGFRYEAFRLKVDFHGPEKIHLPDGRFFTIEPGKATPTT